MCQRGIRDKISFSRKQQKPCKRSPTQIVIYSSITSSEWWSTPGFFIWQIHWLTYQTPRINQDDNNSVWRDNSKHNDTRLSQGHKYMLNMES